MKTVKIGDKIHAEVNGMRIKGEVVRHSSGYACEYDVATDSGIIEHIPNHCIYETIPDALYNNSDYREGVISSFAIFVLVITLIVLVYRFYGLDAVLFGGMVVGALLLWLKYIKI